METFRGYKQGGSRRGIGHVLARVASVTVLAAGIMAAPATARAAGVASGSIELMSGHESSTLDTKLSVPLAKRASLFFRNRSTADYRSGVSPFTLLDLDYNVTDRFCLVCETQFTSENKNAYLAGFGYFRKTGDFSLFVAPGVTLTDETTLTTQIILKYTPPINRTTHLLARLELFSTEDGVGQLGTISRARLGVERGGYNAGFAIDASRFRGTGRTDRNIGVFLQKDF